VFKLENIIGISDMIVDQNNIPLGLRNITEIPNLSVVTGGTLAPNPSELLGSTKMRTLIADLRGQFDRIILDSPPLMAFSDCLVLSRLADGVVFVIWGGETSRDNIIKTVHSIQGVGARILGAVLNNVDFSRSSSSYYYYHPYYDYYYGEKDGVMKGKKKEKHSKFKV
jgi:capsular exopolysaccharide synthesis family protein